MKFSTEFFEMVHNKQWGWALPDLGKFLGDSHYVTNGERDCRFVFQEDLNVIVCSHGLVIPLNTTLYQIGAARN